MLNALVFSNTNNFLRTTAFELSDLCRYQQLESRLTNEWEAIEVLPVAAGN